MQNRSSFLNGAWEEPGVFGLRLEIEKKRLTLLWRMSPVLETAFQTEKREDGSYLLILEKKDLCYAGTSSPYASLTGLVWKDGAITLEEDFPITGKSVSVLRRTEQSRFGNVEIVDREYLPRLQGVWKCGDFGEIVFQKDTLTMDGRSKKIHVARRLSDSELSVISQDPGETELFGFSRMKLVGDLLEVSILVCDAPPMILRYQKEEK